MNESFCRPVINHSKKKFLLIGILVGVSLFLGVALLLGWLPF